MRFLFATDGSRGAEVALDLLCALPLTPADRVTVLTVPVYSFMGTDGLGQRHTDLLPGRGDDAARAVAEAARLRIAFRGPSVGVDVRPGPVSGAIESAALEHVADVIVIGSRGLGAIAGSILGSVARALARDALVPVLVVRERRDAPRRIVVALDESDDAVAAVAILAHLPLPSDAVITLVRLAGEDRDAPEGDGALAHAAARLRPHRIVLAFAARGHTAEQLLARAARSQADLIVLGTHGQRHAAGFLQGSVADQVLSQAHCAVLVAKAPLKPRLVAEAHASGRMALAL